MNHETTRKSEAPNLDWRRKSNLSRITTVVFSLVFFLAVVNLIGTNALATQGVILDQIIKETEEVSRQNQILTVEIGKASNLSYIESAAKRLGFKRVKNNLVISPVEAVAAVIQK